MSVGGWIGSAVTNKLGGGEVSKEDDIKSRMGELKKKPVGLGGQTPPSGPPSREMDKLQKPKADDTWTSSEDPDSFDDDFAAKPKKKPKPKKKTKPAAKKKSKPKPKPKPKPTADDDDS